MSWSLSISGHVDAPDEVARKTEQQILELLEASVREIRRIEGNGLASAMFIGHHVGAHKISGRVTSPRADSDK